ncbi:MAG TPA: ABC transporter substrate-binding protein [Microlunatus sp.]|nr:ABC transporter substrate-binding protein [Microlunatus sp.]
MNRVRLAAGLVAATALLIPFAACSTTTGGGGATDAGTVAQELVASGQYPVENLDPHSVSGGSAGMDLVAKHIYSRLTATDETGKIVGDLATEWSANDAGDTWTFKLRDGVKFTDGSALDSADVVASFQRFLELDSPPAANFPGVEISAPDPTTVVFKSPKPDAAIPSKLTTFHLLPEETPVTEGGVGETPVGSGPFQVESFAAGREVVLVPNPDYFGGAPSLTKLTLQTIPEISTRLTALQTGEVDVVWGVPDDQLAELQAAGSIKTEAVPSAGSVLIWFNSSRPYFKDKPEVRRALWQAIDFATIIEQIHPETGTPADSPIAPTVFGYAPQEPVKYDPEAAKETLTKAGFDFDKTYELQYQSQFKPFVSAIVSDLAEIGVRIDAREKEQAVYIEDLLALRWDINFQQVGSAGFDASTNLGRLYTCAAKRNGYCNPELDKLLAEAGSNPDQAQRQELYAQAGKIIWEDAVGMFPMFVKTSYAWNEKVSGFTLDPQGLPDFRAAKVAGQ